MTVRGGPVVVRGRGRARGLLAAVSASAAVLALVACASPAPAPTVSVPTPRDSLGPFEVSGELVIAAAVSLTAAFEEIALLFEAKHPGVNVLPIEYDGSSTLATQIIEGKAVDVFASADESNLRRVGEAGLIAGGGAVFATNTLVVVVPRGNPAGVESIADLADPAVRVVTCDAAVPCGRAASELLELNRIEVVPVSLEQNVSAVLAKVAAGEADAGLVYATDAARASDVESFVPKRAAEVVNDYAIAALAASQYPDTAAAFIAFVTGDDVAVILGKYGFGRP